MLNQETKHLKINDDGMSKTTFYCLMVGLAPKWIRLDLKLDKSGTFSDQISVHLAHRVVLIARVSDIGRDRARLAKMRLIW